MLEKLANLSVALGLASIAGSLATWVKGMGKGKDEKDHDERLGLLVGLWPPTFFLLAMYLFKLQERGYDTDADKIREKIESNVEDTMERVKT
ncbi:MAG: hypothetical protein WD267_08690 [Balneolales bacterium]